MVERWERELERLDTIEAPPGLRSRIEEGPHGDGVPPAPGRGQRVLAGLVASGVFAAAGVFAFQAFTGPEEGVVGGDQIGVARDLVIVIDLGAGAEGVFEPTARLMYADESIEACTQGSRVENEDGSGSYSSALCGASGPLMVALGSPMRIETSGGGVEVMVRPRDPTRSEGSHLLDIGAVWLDPAPGIVRVEASFIVRVDVVEEPLPFAEAATPAPSDPDDASSSAAPRDPGDPQTWAPTLRVRCEGERVKVLTPTVVAQPRGLVIEPVDVPPDAQIGVRSLNDLGTTYMSGSSGVDGPFVREVPPGPIQVACARAGLQSEEETDDAFRTGQIADLVDPDGVFVPHSVACDELGFFHEHSSGIEVSDPVTTLRGLLDGELASDVIENAGYPRDQDHSREWWRIVRGGQVVASLLVGEQGGGTVAAWICSSSGISLGAKE